MRRKIVDEFSHLPISRQRKYQLRMARDGRCTECGDAAVHGSRCLKHLVSARERQRETRGLRKRYYNTLSYRLENGSADALKQTIAAIKKQLRAKGIKAEPKRKRRGKQPIVDEFTKLPISRQRKYQLRRMRDGLCTECGQPAILGSRCMDHLIKARERQRSNKGLRKRYHNTLSYRLQTDPEAVAKLAAKIAKPAAKAPEQEKS